MALEAVIVYSAVFLLMLAMIDGAMGVFWYEQVACQARDAARWASVRGSGWQQETGQTSPSQSDILNNVVVPLEVGMDPCKVTLLAQWIDQTTGQASNWDSASKSPKSSTATGGVVTNHVRVTVTYKWTPSFFPVGPLNLRSVSQMPMSF
jgi:hypothetical protein